jgi:uncharacterized protein
VFACLNLAANLLTSARKRARSTIGICSAGRSGSLHACTAIDNLAFAKYHGANVPQRPKKKGATDMSTEVPQNPQPQAGVSQDDRTMALLAHLLGIVLGVIGPLIIWLIKKDQSEFVNDQGKEALNFQITVLICAIAASILSFVIIGFLLYPIIVVGEIVLAIMGGIKANEGVRYRYPINIRFIK